MNLIWSKDRSQGFTVLDLIIVLATVMLVVLLLPMFAWHGDRVPAARIHCVSNLKQVGLGFRMWSADHGEKFPMAISSAKGGSLEFLSAEEVFRHFTAASNEIHSPKVLACTSDLGRKQTTNFATLSNRNLSYFVGLDADEHDPQTILSGDRNISTNGSMVSGILPLTGKPAVSWTKEIHVHRGNIGLADGSVQQVSDAALMSQINSSTNLSARLAIP